MSDQVKLRTYMCHSGALDIDRNVIFPKTGCSKFGNISLHVYMYRWSFVNVRKAISGMCKFKSLFIYCSSKVVRPSFR